MNVFIPNSFQVPNAFVDVAMSQLSDNALRCYLAIIRKTVGWNKESDVISLSQFEKATGKSRHSVLKGINELLALNLISKVEVGTKMGKMNSYTLLRNEQSLQGGGAEYARGAKFSLVQNVQGGGAKCASDPVHSLHPQSTNIQNPIIQNTGVTREQAHAEPHHGDCLDNDFCFENSLLKGVEPCEKQPAPTFEKILQLYPRGIKQWQL